MSIATLAPDFGSFFRTIFGPTLTSKWERQECGNGVWYCAKATEFAVLVVTADTMRYIWAVETVDYEVLKKGYEPSFEDAKQAATQAAIELFRADIAALEGA